MSHIYAALKNFGPVFEELNKRSVLGVALVKYCFKIKYKKTWKYSKRVQTCPYHVYIIDTCAAKTSTLKDNIHTST